MIISALSDAAGGRMDLAEHTVLPTLRSLLVDATAGVHERMHRHIGFAAVKNGTTSLDDYRNLVSRLFGYYYNLVHLGWRYDERLIWLEEDLISLGLKASDLQRLAKYNDFPEIHNLHQELGAAYVIEGSALGGRQLARGLNDLLGLEATAGRRFFQGYGLQTGAVWRQYLNALEAVPRDGALQRQVLDAAVTTFSSFELWMAGWKDQSDE